MVDTIVGISEYTFGGRAFVRAASSYGWDERFGSWKCRWGVWRMHYIVAPGLYAVGSPDGDSPVMVSCNYKMSFDRLRRDLGGMDAWILVIDTNGINVWCAAGKGTFGTDEIVRRVEEFKLGEVVSHRELIVPQLGAPSVSGHGVRKACGFKVTYGPVRSKDIAAFMGAGKKATDEMRRVKFGLVDRAVLVPMDIVMGLKIGVFVAACLFVLGGIYRGGYSSDLAMSVGGKSAVLFLGSFFWVAVLGPLLLPWLWGRAFALKGVWVGLGLLVVVGCFNDFLADGWFWAGAWVLAIPALSSFVLMNFTGASTYTSLSGVKREMRIAVPVQIGCVIAAACLWIVNLFL
ncbi:MAG: acetyl-CoA synthase subunit gamma [Planctomycetes bacterium]|nr:acetyl-CoA synthase subunit gamma [Planctomycetota bacterium]